MSDWTVSAARSGAYTIRNGSLDDLSGRGGLLLIDDGLPDSVVGIISSMWDGEAREVPGGEAIKSWAGLRMLTDLMEETGLHRRDEVVIVGGGALLDAGGFAASIYRRGLPYVRVPTTLLAYVDASVGVKVAINTGERKNLLGAFSPPSEVILIPELMRSLPTEEVASGMGEIVKLAAGCEPTLLPLLQEAVSAAEYVASPDARPLLDAAIAVMLRELQPNLYEGDLTRAVDLGHTFGLPLEIRGMRHGETVTLDVLLSAAISTGRGLLPPDQLRQLRDVAGHLLLPPRPTVAWSPETLAESLGERSRHRGGSQRVPLPAIIGSCIFADDVTLDEVRRATDLLKWS